MTFLAFGAKCGEPDGSSPRAIPSLCSIAPRARPAKPIPTSPRKPRRVVAEPNRIAGSSSSSCDQRIVTKSLWLKRT